MWFRVHGSLVTLSETIGDSGDRADLRERDWQYRHEGRHTCCWVGYSIPAGYQSNSEGDASGC